MLAMSYRGPRRVRIDEKPEPTIQHPQDSILKVTRACNCGSDLHLYNGSVPDTPFGSPFGHEVTGIIEEVGSEVTNLKAGDRVLVPFNISCGKCVFCRQGLFGNCHESNPETTAVGGIFGYSHTAGRYALVRSVRGSSERETDSDGSNARGTHDGESESGLGF